MNNILPINGIIGKNKTGIQYPQIILGEVICEKIKDIYFSDKKWSDCYKDVSIKYTILKNIARKFYCDRDEVEILKEISRYTYKDIQEALENATD